MEWAPLFLLLILTFIYKSHMAQRQERKKIISKKISIPSRILLTFVIQQIDSFSLTQFWREDQILLNKRWVQSHFIHTNFILTNDQLYLKRFILKNYKKYETNIEYNLNHKITVLAEINEEIFGKQSVTKSSTKSRICAPNVLKTEKTKKRKVQQYKNIHQIQLEKMFFQIINILCAMNQITEERVFNNILREHVLETKKNALHLMKRKNVIDQEIQELSKREQLNYYQKRLRYFSRFKEWVQQVCKMQKMDLQDWEKNVQTAQFPQLFHFILDELDVQVFFDSRLTIMKVIDLYIKFIYAFQNQEKGFIQFHLTKIKLFLLDLETIQREHLSPQDPIALFLNVNYAGKQSIKNLLVQPKVYQVCQQYFKWKIYLASR